jgi:hypothetical protein
VRYSDELLDSFLDLFVSLDHPVVVPDLLRGKAKHTANITPRFFLFWGLNNLPSFIVFSSRDRRFRTNRGAPAGDFLVWARFKFAVQTTLY